MSSHLSRIVLWARLQRERGERDNVAENTVAMHCNVDSRRFQQIHGARLILIPTQTSAGYWMLDKSTERWRCSDDGVCSLCCQEKPSKSDCELLSIDRRTQSEYLPSEWWNFCAADDLAWYSGKIRKDFLLCFSVLLWRGFVYCTEPNRKKRKKWSRTWSHHRWNLTRECQSRS